MLTCQWQRLGPDLGAGVPEEVREAGVGGEYERALELSHAEFDRLEAAGLAEAAPYALCLGYRIRYVLDLNAREAMHLCELRSGREGHPTYRAVAQAMHERIAAVHPAVGAAMMHVDATTEPRLERILSEIRTHRKRLAAAVERRPARRELPGLGQALGPLGGLGRRDAERALGEALALDPERPVEARAVVLERDDARQLDQLRLVQVLAELRRRADRAPPRGCATSPVA